jgi:UDP-N-acetylmuramate--alanine ligase
MIKNIHFVGIKGVGMTSLAVLVKEAGLQVTGSDLGEQFITDITLQQAGITPLVGFSSEHVNQADLVITTGAHGGFDNPEVISAKEKGTRVMSLAEAIGFVMSGELFGRKLIGISIAGTHGKTTTSAMAATVLKENALDPSYLIGTSKVASLGASGHYKVFLAAAKNCCFY